ncbi:hypothetical protein BAE44_0013751, partial [Dichanthelium oligosanthes]
LVTRENPYLVGGCKRTGDINECDFPSVYPCFGLCINTIGNYNCSCLAGTQSEGRHISFFGFLIFLILMHSAFYHRRNRRRHQK